MASERISLDISNKLAVIKFKRPKMKNAFDLEMYKELTKILNELSNRDDVTITVLTGTGDFYSSGNDLSAVLKLNTNIDEAIDIAVFIVRDFVNAFITHSKVLVAVVNGPAIGIAVTTLPLCDIVYCTPTAWFATPFTKLGICAEACSSYTFPRILGNSKANEMILFNGKLTAEEAVATGLVSKLVPPDQMAQVWDVLRHNAAELSAKSLNTSKQLMRKFSALKLHEANRDECENLRILFRSDEAKEAILKFLTRRSNL